MASNISLYALALAAFAVCSTHGYSSGAPSDACGDMTPQHHTPAQKTPLPYTINISSKESRSGAPVQITITGKGPEDTIKGLLVQARTAHGEKVVGKFQVDSNDKFLQLINCAKGEGNAVTHRKHPDNEDKRSVTLTWIPPPNLKDEVTFRATIARNGGVFWVAQKSEAVRVF